MKDARIMPFI